MNACNRCSESRDFGKRVFIFFVRIRFSALLSAIGGHVENNYRDVMPRFKAMLVLVSLGGFFCVVFTFHPFFFGLGAWG